MIQFRCLAHVVLVSALAAGCSQSLFDDGGRLDSGPGPVPDARQAPPDADTTAPDADITAPDAGLMPPPDADIAPRPDASQDCVGQCDYDAFDDFNGSPTGRNGRWRYVEVQPDPVNYADMRSFAFPDDVTGFIGTGTPAPSLAHCSNEETSPPCFELQGFLALTTTAPGASHPALMFTVPESGSYSVVVSYRASSGAPDVDTTMMLTLNNQSNVLDSKTNPIMEGVSQLYAEPPLAAGDVLVVSAIATTETRVSVGVNVTVTGPY